MSNVPAGRGGPPAWAIGLGAAVVVLSIAIVVLVRMVLTQSPQQPTSQPLGVGTPTQVAARGPAPTATARGAAPAAPSAPGQAVLDIIGVPGAQAEAEVRTLPTDPAAPVAVAPPPAAPGVSAPPPAPPAVAPAPAASAPAPGVAAPAPGAPAAPPGVPSVPDPALPVLPAPAAAPELPAAPETPEAPATDPVAPAAPIAVPAPPSAPGAPPPGLPIDPLPPIAGGSPEGTGVPEQRPPDPIPAAILPRSAGVLFAGGPSGGAAAQPAGPGSGPAGGGLPPVVAVDQSRALLTGSRGQSAARQLIIPPAALERKAGEVEICAGTDLGPPCISVGADVADLRARLGTQNVGSIELPVGQIVAFFSDANFAGACTTVALTTLRLNQNAGSARIGNSCKAFAEPPEPDRLIVSGQTLTGRIEPSSQRDFFRFEGRAGQVALIRLERTAGNLDPFVYLYDATALIVLDQDDDAGGDRNSVIAITLPNTGVYFIAAASFASRSVGDYRISLTLSDQLPLDEPDRDIGRGQIARAFIAPAGDVDRFQFFAEAGQIMSLFLERPNASTITPQLSVRDPNGSPVCLPQPAGPPLCQVTDLVLASMSPVILPTTGRYTISVSGANGTTGAYTLTLDIVPAQFISGGDTLTGVVDPPGTRAAFIFDGQAGEFITFHVVRTGGDLRPVMFLYDPLDTITKGAIINNGEETILRDYPILVAGRHILLVSGQGATTGAFRATMTRATQPPVGPRQVCSGQVVGGRISATGQVDTFAFDAFRGVARLTLRPGVGSALTPNVVLKDPQGQSVAPFAGGLFSLPSNGRYTVEVRASGGTTGTYTLSASLFRLLIPGSPIAGRFTCTDETHFFFLDGVAGETVTLSMTRLDGDLIPLLLLANSADTFQTFSSNDGKDNARIVTLLPETDTYTMLASPLRGLGAYLLTMATTGGAASAGAVPNPSATPAALKLATAPPMLTPSATSTSGGPAAFTPTPTLPGIAATPASTPVPGPNGTITPLGTGVGQSGPLAQSGNTVGTTTPGPAAPASSISTLSGAASRTATATIAATASPTSFGSPSESPVVTPTPTRSTTPTTTATPTTSATKVPLAAQSMRGSAGIQWSSAQGRESGR
jgi:hypothetical protein